MSRAHLCCRYFTAGISKLRHEVEKKSEQQFLIQSSVTALRSLQQARYSSVPLIVWFANNTNIDCDLHIGSVCVILFLPQMTKLVANFFFFYCTLFCRTD